MATVSRQLLIPALFLAALCLSAESDSSPEKLVSVGKIQPQTVSEFGDFLGNTFGSPGERHSKNETIPAKAVLPNGEVPDSPWYVNRHAKRRMTRSELQRGPGNSTPPSATGSWTIVSAKTEGITPGFIIVDSAGNKFLLKFDPYDFPELASAADVVSSKFYHALGYYVPENYIVNFYENQLVLKQGDEKGLTPKKLQKALGRLRKGEDGRIRAMASKFLDGEPVGPFLFYGRRADDPNDRIPHEHRRELRGLYLFNTWLNHTDSKSGNSLDTVVTEGGARYVRHHLIDFGATLGSATHEAKSPRQGHEYLIEFKPSLLQLVTLGAHVPKWARAHYSKLPSVGAFEAEAFDPEKWRPSYPNPAFENRLPEDLSWASSKIAAFTDADIAAIVETGQYSDPEAAEWITRNLILRRDKILARYPANSVRQQPAVAVDR